MPKGYWIARMDVRDAAVYDAYRAANAKPLADYGAKFLVRGGKQDVREGDWRSRTVVLEFPSLAEARACYDSEDYQKAKNLRLPVADGDLVIIEGYDS